MSQISDDLRGQYCNMNCICCSAPFLATAGLSCLWTCALQLVVWIDCILFTHYGFLVQYIVRKIYN